MILRILIASVLVWLGLLPGVAGAQTFSEPGFPAPDPGQVRPTGPLGITIELGIASGDDHIGLSNAYSAAGSIDFSDELGTAIADALDVPRSRSDVGFDGGTFDYDYTYDTVVSIEKRLSKARGDDRVVDVDTAEIARVARQWQYQNVDLSVCSQLPLDDQSARPGTDDDDCRGWRFATAAGDASVPGIVSVVQETDVDSYSTLVGVSTAVVVIATILLSGLTSLLRRGPLRYFGGGVLGLVALFTLLGVIAWGVGAIVLAIVQRPVSDFVVANDLGGGGAFVAHVLPALLYALPFVGPAIVLSRARPRPPTVVGDARHAPMPAAPPTSAPGVPSWLDRPASQSQPDAPQPDAPQPPPDAPQAERHRQPNPFAGDDDGSSWRAPS